MLILRVSGLRNRLSRNAIAGTMMGYISAVLRLCVDTYAAVVMTGTRPPPQPLPMWYGTDTEVYRMRAGKYSARNAPIGPYTMPTYETMMATIKIASG